MSSNKIDSIYYYNNPVNELYDILTLHLKFKFLFKCLFQPMYLELVKLAVKRSNLCLKMRFNEEVTGLQKSVVCYKEIFNGKFNKIRVEYPIH